MTGFDQYIAQATGAHQRRIKAEKKLVTALVDAGLKRGYLVSVNDSEEWVIKRSTERAKILSALYSTDEDRIVFRTPDTKRVGWFLLIYGNCGYDVISDYSVTDACDEIWNELKPLMDRLERGA